MHGDVDGENRCSARLRRFDRRHTRRRAGSHGAALRDYGRHLGVAFQAVDDLLGIWGEPTTTGKPVGNDIRLRKKSMPIVAALAAGDDAARELDALLFGEPGRGNGNSADGLWVDEQRLDGQSVDKHAWPNGNREMVVRECDRVPRALSQRGAGDAQAARPGRSGTGDMAGGSLRREGMDSGKGQGAPRRSARGLERARLSAVPRRQLADIAVYVVERES